MNRSERGDRKHSSAKRFGVEEGENLLVGLGRKFNQRRFLRASELCRKFHELPQPPRDLERIPHSLDSATPGTSEVHSEHLPPVNRWDWLEITATRNQELVEETPNNFQEFPTSSDDLRSESVMIELSLEMEVIYHELRINRNLGRAADIESDPSSPNRWR